MEAQIKLGRVFGIPIGLHYSWVLIAVLIVLSLHAHLESTNPAWGGAVIWTAAVAAGLLFFATLLAHELAHSLVARSRGLPVRSITLFALGGVSEIEREAPDAKTEFWVAVVGPLSSLVIGIAFLGLAVALGWTQMSTPSTPGLAAIVWLGYVNVSLAVFNLVPGFPLDGGRILRSVIWWITGNARRATFIAARAGQLVATALILVGIMRLFSGAGLSALWIVFIGWFLLQAARASYAEYEIGDRLRGVRVADIMDVDCVTIDADTDLQTFADEYLLRTGRRCFVVVKDGFVSGIVTLNEVKSVDRGQWRNTLVSNVIRPLDQLRSVAPDTPLKSALEIMTREDLNQLPVVSEGRLEGIVSRARVLSLLQNVIELNR